MIGRIVVASAGLSAAAYGAFRLLELGWDNLVATVVWLVGGVLLHDAVLAPATIALCALGMAVLPAATRAPAAAGLLILGSVTLTAIPVLGRFGARADNVTLLDRDYASGWLMFAALTLVGVAVARVAQRRRAGSQPAQKP